MTILVMFLVLLFGASCGPQQQRSRPKAELQTIPMPPPVCYPEGDGPFPAILVFPQAVHNIANEKFVAEKLATEGYVAQAVDYGNRKFIGMFNDPARMDDFKRLACESLAALKTRPRVDASRIGVIGHSLGGFFVTYLASKPDEIGIRAGVIYYGVYDVPAAIKNLRVPILAFQGDADQMPEFIRQALAMNHHKQFELVFFTKAHHGFQYGPLSSRAGPYDQAAIKSSWIRMIAFLEKHVKQLHSWSAFPD
jgi:dienelactone hydrolase